MTTTTGPANVRSLTPWAAAGVCAVLLVLFAATSWWAACTKSVTSDEAIHAPAGYSYWKHFDFRTNPEHPPLAKLWATLPWVLGTPPDLAEEGPEWRGIPEDLNNQWNWGRRVLFQTPTNDTATLMAQARFMMTLTGVALGAVLAWWAWRLAGAAAAVLTCALYAFDPNFLAHASLVTNDVAFTLTTVCVAYCLWRLGRGVTFRWVVALSLACGVANGMKFTGVLLGPVVGLTLLARAGLGPWVVFGRTLATWWKRVVAAVGIGVFVGLVTWGCVWASYGFRERTAPDYAVHANYRQLMADSAVGELLEQNGRRPTPAELGEWEPSPAVNRFVWILKSHLLPDAYVSGLWVAYSKSLYRLGYLMGQVYGGGRWDYFPVASLVKMPVGTVLLMAAAMAVAAARAGHVWRGLRQDGGPSDRSWAVVCVGLTVAVLGAATMRSSMNIGIRHFLPVYVFGLLAGGAVIGRCWDRWAAVRSAAARWVILVIVAAVGVESLAAFPNYIPFLNGAARAARGPLYWLGDSNVDWGQDLPLLAGWQDRNPLRVLHLAYFGTAEPAYYGVRANEVLRQGGLVVPDRPMPRSGVIAVSATALQGIYLGPGQPNPFAYLLDRTPTEVLGGSIYVYDLDRPAAAAAGEATR